MHFEYEMTYREQIDGPLPSTNGSPFGERFCWKVASGTLAGPRIEAKIVMPGMDWIRLGADGIRRQDLRTQLMTSDGAVILFHYDSGIIRGDESFRDALTRGHETSWTDQYMRIVPEFDVGDERYAWLTQSLFMGEGRLAGFHEIEYRIYRID